MADDEEDLDGSVSQSVGQSVSRSVSQLVDQVSEERKAEGEPWVVWGVGTVRRSRGVKHIFVVVGMTSVVVDVVDEELLLSNVSVGHTTSQ